MKPKISIIMPIYNVEKYLRRSLDSVLSQTLSDIEVIAINDGSTDASLDILYEYAQRDERIIVVNSENGGVSSARNIGIERAKGEFLGFVDPDDWVSKEMFKELYNIATLEQADVAMCSYMREFGTHSKEKTFDLSDMTCYRNQDLHSKILRRLIGPLNEEVSNPEMLDAWGTVWSKLYRADLIKEHSITFTDLSLIGTNEDTLFNIHVLYYSKSFIFTNRALYHYWRANDLSVTSTYKPQLLEGWINLYTIIEAFLKENNLGPDYYKALNNRICLNTLGLGLNEISQTTFSNIKKIKSLQTILKHNRIQESFEQLELAKFPFVWRTFYYCAKTRKAVGLYLMLMSIEYLRKRVK